MRHRLFCSLVLSSSFLVEGCATTHSAPSGDAGAPDDDTADDAALSRADDAGFAPRDASAPAADSWVLAEPDAAPAGDDAGLLTDPRACEPGWPTTKGTFHVTRDGLVHGCRYLEGSTPDMPDLDRCCIVGPAS
jgi:hypothetical protein